MTWDLKNDRPIYIQLVEQITLLIISGQFEAGSRLASVRDLATEARVNPNTMQKALAELERIGLVHTNRTSGRFITEDTKMIEEMKKNLAKEELKTFLEQMKQLGFTDEEIKTFIIENCSN
ncbi:GntR family transcriptional regulator [Velocimicrobium porci]|uniref:GntR family transcriptional regulator n=1 Tax=Velocimicrobium porci TaxID=2606634 RepID=A0A6L5Y0P3_9FIRM|nr:GntR family transcriptional regulator [Velocimicrobium porci]MSS64696.1 GntR family transcriptional regulator [Velocimicrobium porci]